jgi:glycogen(starch) synthase
MTPAYGRDNDIGTRTGRRILMTADTVGGVWTYALELARGLAWQGDHVVLATMGAPPNAAQAAEVRSASLMALETGDFRLEWMQDCWEDVDRAGAWLLDLEQRYRPDVIHLNGYAHGALPWEAPVLLVAHSCVPSWWRAVKGEAAGPEWEEYRARVRAGLDAAECVVAPTAAMRDALIAEHGPLFWCPVIPNGRDPAQFRPAPKEPFVLAAGRLWDEAKNIDALCRVASDLPWPIHVAGETSHPEHGGATEPTGVTPLGLLSNAQMAQTLARAAIYALPARYEPFGLSALEAGLCGCALVLGDIPSLREVWADAALFVPPDDVAALHDCLENLMHDDAFRTELSARSCARARRFSADLMAVRYSRLYTELLYSSRAEAPSLDA